MLTARKSQRPMRLAPARTIGAAALAAAFLAAGQPSAAQMPEPSVALPEPVSGLPATANRQKPRTVEHEGASYDHFRVRLTVEETDFSSVYVSFVIYADCRASKIAVVSDYEHGGNIADGPYTLPPEVRPEIVFVDEAGPDASLGIANMKTMCSLK